MSNELVDTVEGAIRNAIAEQFGSIHMAGEPTAARAAIAAVFDEIERHLSAVQYDPAPYTAMKHRLSTMRREALGDGL